ncbi:MAG: LuxR C-terminal-related transcriptional regulator, partial [Pseudonocardia sp.]|nr:LuxR C-terminal-related transcriptional regulator [Pseudonocardia sp.]
MAGPADVDIGSYLARARAAGAAGDWDSAYRAFTEAGRHAPLPVDAERGLGLAAWWLGRIPESLALAERTHRRQLADGEVEQAAGDAVELAVMLLLRGETAVGSGWLSRAQRLLEGRPECQALGLLRYVECLGALGADLPAALVGGRRLRAMGERLPDATLTALGLMVEGTAQVRGGGVDAGFALLDESMLGVVAGQVLPEYAGAIYCNLMEVCHQVADVERARQWTEATERWCGAFSSAVMFVGICRVHRAQLLALEGEWDRAAELARRVCGDLDGVAVSAVADAFCLLADVQRLRGDLDAAGEALGRARELGGCVQPEDALLRLARRQHGPALAGIRQALVEHGDDPFRRARILYATVEIAEQAGEPEVAGRAAGELDEIATTYGSRGLLARSWHARGLALLAAGDAARAVPVLERGGRAFRAMRAPYLSAQVTLALARCHRALGDTDTADTEDTIAHQLLDGLGAHPGCDDRPGGLTDRELEVLRHVAQGASNRQVSAELCITEKTVGRHLSNIYLKLDVTSRTA